MKAARKGNISMKYKCTFIPDEESIQEEFSKEIEAESVKHAIYIFVTENVKNNCVVEAENYGMFIVSLVDNKYYVEQFLSNTREDFNKLNFIN